MNQETGSRASQVESLLLELVRIPSITGTPGEEAVVRHIHQRFLELDYFKENPDHLAHFSSTLPDIPEPLHGVFALVKSARPTRNTILLIGHVDVVEVQCYGSLRRLAFDPPALIREMASLELPEAARKDLESGNYLFGRGTMDMKLGVALEMDLVREFAADPSLWPVNVAMLAVGDEENNNGGMRVGAQFLSTALADLDLDPVCVLNTEPSDAGQPGADRQMIFQGTIGKLLPFFYLVGAPSHAGSYYQGLSASLMAAYVHTVLEANPDLADSDQGEVTGPPLALGLELRNREYSVTLPDRAATYFNYFFLKKTPSRILEEMRGIADKAGALARDHVKRSWEALGKRGFSGPHADLPVKVLTCKELLELARSRFKGDLDQEMARFTGEIPRNLDAREKGFRVVEHLLEVSGAGAPMIVTGLLPPFLPPRSNPGTSPKEETLGRAVEALTDYSKNRYGIDLERAVYFTGISDMSYVGANVDAEEFAGVSANIPGWGHIYTIPFDAIAALDVPVINIGPMGRDAHKMTERLEKDYALGILPDLIRHFIGRF